MGYVTGEISAADAAQIDTLLAATARSLGADDPRSYQQRRADLFTDLLLGHLQLVDEPWTTRPTTATTTTATTTQDGPTRVEEGPEPRTPAEDAAAGHGRVERAGRLVGGRGHRPRHRGTARHPPRNPSTPPANPPASRCRTHPSRRRSSRRSSGGRRPSGSASWCPSRACSASARRPGELADRSAMMPADQIRAADRRHPRRQREGRDPRDQVLFTRLLTDHGGRLLDTTELGRFPSRRLAEAIRLRAGTCCHPTCTVPADPVRHRPPPPPPRRAHRRNTTSTRNADDTTAATPSPGKPPSATTTASTGPCPTPNATDVSTSRCPSEATEGLTTKPSTRRHTFGVRRPSDKTQTLRRSTLPCRLDPGVEIGRPVSRWGRRCRSRDRSARGA